MQYTPLPYPFGRALAEKGIKSYFCWEFVPSAGILVYGHDLALKTTLSKTDVKKAFSSTKEEASNSLEEAFI